GRRAATSRSLSSRRWRCLACSRRDFSLCPRQQYRHANCACALAQGDAPVCCRTTRSWLRFRPSASCACVPGAACRWREGCGPERRIARARCGFSSFDARLASTATCPPPFSRCRRCCGESRVWPALAVTIDALAQPLSLVFCTPGVLLHRDRQLPGVIEFLAGHPASIVANVHLELAADSLPEINGMPKLANEGDRPKLVALPALQCARRPGGKLGVFLQGCAITAAFAQRIPHGVVRSFARLAQRRLRWPRARALAQLIGAQAGDDLDLFGQEEDVVAQRVRLASQDFVGYGCFTPRHNGEPYGEPRRPLAFGSNRKNPMKPFLCMVGRDGIEPSTNGLKVRCSTAELTAPASINKSSREGRLSLSLLRERARGKGDISGTRYSNC